MIFSVERVQATMSVGSGLAVAYIQVPQEAFELNEVDI